MERAGPVPRPKRGSASERNRKSLKAKGIGAGKSVADYPLDNSRYNE
jgi:hypothetical protein